jgi:uncharacterized Zn finger protein
MWFRDSFPRFAPRSGPRAVSGGIRAQSKSGAFGKTWWAKRWIDVLESFDMGGRLSRGRSYARNGQVTDIGIASGKVTAKVQGSRLAPYQVKISVTTLTEPEWETLVAELNTQVSFAAKLLAGEMPQDIEEAFAKAGLSLFPKSLTEIITSCSCPDWSNPCKHIAAVYYLLGEEFDRDPFLLFRLRGTERDALCGRLSAMSEPASPEVPEPEPAEPLPADAATFWACGPLPTGMFADVRRPPVDAATPKRLGGFPFWRGSEIFLDAMAPIYAAASQRGLDRFEASASTSGDTSVETAGESPD